MLLDIGIAIMLVGLGLILLSIVLRLTWARRPGDTLIRWSRADWRGAVDQTDSPLFRTGSSAHGMDGGNAFVDEFTSDKST
jgi:hypothetical protein